MQLVGKIAHQHYIKMLIVNTLEKTPTPAGECGSEGRNRGGLR